MRLGNDVPSDSIITYSLMEYEKCQTFTQIAAFSESNKNPQLSTGKICLFI